MATQITITTASGESRVSLSTGARGLPGAPGATDYTELDNIPSTFAPSAHASSHATGGSDPITPTSIGAANTTHTHTSADITDTSAIGSPLKVVRTDSDGSIEFMQENGHIRTEGDAGTIETWGANASIGTFGVNAFIQTRSTFKFFDGTYTTTLSGTQTANRSISYPNANGTLLISSNNLSDVTAATARTNLGGGTVGQSLFTSATIADARTALQETVLSPSSEVSVTSTTTHATITGMTWTVAAGEVWEIAFFGMIDTGTGGGDVRLLLPSILGGTSGTNQGFGQRMNPGISAAVGVPSSSATTLRVARETTTAAVRPVYAHFFFVVGASGGTAEFQFTQASNDAAASKLLVQTRAIIKKI